MPAGTVAAMVVTPHALVGALAGRLMPGPVSALAAGGVSHFALDRIPHTDYDIHTAAGAAIGVADVSLAAVLLYAIWRRDWRAACGAVGAVAPDVAQIAEAQFGVDIHRGLHAAIHTPVVPSMTVGIATQMVTVALACWLSWLLASRARRRAAAAAAPEADRG